MKQIVKEKWVKALRSGKYTKGKGALKTKKNTYCCLGVLTDLYSKETGRGKWTKNKLDDPAFKVNNETNGGTLPRSVQKWAGLNDPNPRVWVGTVVTRREKTLASVNDHTRASFKGIAKLIETNL